MVSLLALPAYWLCMTRLFLQPSGLPDPPRGPLLVEIALIVVFAVGYALAWWQSPMWATSIVLALHFGFWGWLFLGGLRFWHAPFQLLAPAVGFLSSLAWASRGTASSNSVALRTL